MARKSLQKNASKFSLSEETLECRIANEVTRRLPASAAWILPALRYLSPTPSGRACGPLLSPCWKGSQAPGSVPGVATPQAEGEHNTDFLK